MQYCGVRHVIHFHQAARAEVRCRRRAFHTSRFHEARLGEPELAALLRIAGSPPVESLAERVTFHEED